MSEADAICGSTLEGNSGQYIISPCVVSESYWTYDFLSGINIDVIIICIDIILFWVILYMIETNVFTKGWTRLMERIYGTDVPPQRNIDDDVKLEQESVYTNNDNLVRVINLTKKFGKFSAVRELTFGVRKVII